MSDYVVHFMCHDHQFYYGSCHSEGSEFSKIEMQCIILL